MSSDVVPVLESGKRVYLITPTRQIPVIHDAPTLENAVSALQRAAPPSSVKCVFVEVTFPNFKLIQRSVEALQKAGYTNIESIHNVSMALSATIYNVPLNCAIGEPVFIYYPNWSFGNAEHGRLECSVFVLQKRKKGWQILQLRQDPREALVCYPSVKNVIVCDDQESPMTRAHKAEVQKFFKGQKLHPTRMALHADFNEKFIRNRINKGNLDGYEVLPYCAVDVSIKFGNEEDLIKLSDRVPPFTITKEVDVGDASDVKVYAVSSEETEPYPIIKIFKFKSHASRTVSITINVDKTLVPQVTLKTVAAREPHTSKSSDANTNFAGIIDFTDKFIKLCNEAGDPDETGEDRLTRALSQLLDEGIIYKDDKEVVVANKSKKNRSQRRRLARQNAKNSKLDEPTASTKLPVSTDAVIDQTESLSTLSDEMSKLELSTRPKTVLTFTSDNRVMIKADESYTGDEQLLAYVRLEAGKPPVVGQLAFDALRKHPENVFYDITRLLATDFDPDHPNPSWGFKATRDADGTVMIHGGNDITTFPIVLFGIVIRSTLLYIGKHIKSDVSSLGIRVPSGSVVSENDLKRVSERLGVELILMNC